MKQTLLLLQIRGEVIRVASLLYTSEFLTEQDCNLIIELMQDRISDIKACQPK